MNEQEKEQIAKRMAKSTREWWQYHHIKEELGVIHSMAEEVQALFNAFGFVLLHKEAMEIVKPHAKAAMLHDKAEEFGDQGQAGKEAIYWAKVEELLLEYSKNLINEIDRQMSKQKV